MHDSQKTLDIIQNAKTSILAFFINQMMDGQQYLQVLDTKKPTKGLCRSSKSMCWNVLVMFISCKKRKKTLFSIIASMAFINDFQT